MNEVQKSIVINGKLVPMDLLVDESGAKLATSDNPNEWWTVSGSEAKYHAQTAVNCPFHPDHLKMCLVDGWSHNDEPQTTSGAWECKSCGKYGIWTEADSHDWIGHSGQSTSRKMRMVRAEVK